MNHNLAHKAFRLRGLALQLERGQLDAEFAAAEVPIADMREAVVHRIRQLADAIGNPET